MPLQHEETPGLPIKQLPTIMQDNVVIKSFKLSTNTGNVIEKGIMYLLDLCCTLELCRTAVLLEEF